MKVSADFGSDAFLPMLVDICWIYTEGHPGIFFFISLGSLVLFKDSKTMVRFFGGRNFELLQCSAEGWELLTFIGVLSFAQLAQLCTALPITFFQLFMSFLVDFHILYNI